MLCKKMEWLSCNSYHLCKIEWLSCTSFNFFTPLSLVYALNCKFLMIFISLCSQLQSLTDFLEFVHSSANSCCFLEVCAFKCKFLLFFGSLCIQVQILANFFEFAQSKMQEKWGCRFGFSHLRQPRAKI